MKTNAENAYNYKQSQRIFIFVGFVLIIPTIYFLMFPSYLITTTRPLRHKMKYKHSNATSTSPKIRHTMNIWDKPFKPQHIPDDVELDIISKQYPNIPLKFWKKVEKDQSQMYLSNSSCAPFPDMYALNIHNTFWQQIDMTNHTTVQVFSAYYDKRNISGQVVRILSMVNKTNINFPGDGKFYCQFWFEGEKQPVIAPMDKPEYMWFEYFKSHSDGLWGPYLLGCSIPDSHKNKIPKVVSFVERPCDKAHNMLQVIYEEPKKKEEFTICVKGLDFPQEDITVRLVEWIEFVLLMGVDKIHMYQLEIHPNTKKVLDYYKKLGKIDIRELTLPSGNPSIPFLQHIFIHENNLVQCLDEIIPYNDCFYRNIYSYKYVAIFDIDEMIVPLRDRNWHDLIQRALKYGEIAMPLNGFTARHIYFLDTMQKEGPYRDLPTYMHMMQHVYKSSKFNNPGDFVKTMFSTDYIISCFNHWPISIAPDTDTLEFRLEDAQMRHYRDECSWEVNCTEYSLQTVKDTRMWDFKDELVPRVNKVLKDIGYLQEI